MLSQSKIMLSQYKDVELWQMLKNDSEMAFEEMYNRYAKSMFTFAMSIFKKREICEDIVQNVFVDIWSRRKDVEVLNLKFYLLQSVRFQVFKSMRDIKVPLEDLTRVKLSDESGDILGQIEYDELESVLKAKVETLPPACQKIFVMSRISYKTNNEIATELGISVQAVKNQVSKALKVLRAGLPTHIH